jgi:triosephosphate isomerase (TIM)
MKKLLIVGNWKMAPNTAKEAVKIWKPIQKTAHNLKHVETVICPPAVYLAHLGTLVTDRNCVLGAQDVSADTDVPHTGEISAPMVFDARARYAIIGHSERRARGETDETVAAKLRTILSYPLSPIVCVGESVRDDSGAWVRELKKQVKTIVSGLTEVQLARVVIAYEPIWAIGSKAKRSATPSECRDAVGVIRQIVADILKSDTVAQSMTALYGGSVNPENAIEFLQDGGIQGFLVGRASLDAKAFVQILKVAETKAKKS